MAEGIDWAKRRHWLQQGEETAAAAKAQAQAAQTAARAAEQAARAAELATLIPAVERGDDATCGRDCHRRARPSH